MSSHSCALVAIYLILVSMFLLLCFVASPILSANYSSECMLKLPALVSSLLSLPYAVLPPEFVDLLLHVF